MCGRQSQFTVAPIKSNIQTELLKERRLHLAMKKFTFVLALLVSDLILIGMANGINAQMTFSDGWGNKASSIIISFWGIFSI